MSAPAWVRRFDPAFFVRESEASGWVTDKSRAHRAPPQVVSWLDGECGFTVMACRIDWPDATPQIATDEGLPMSHPLGLAPHARSLRPWSIDATSGVVRFVTGSMQLISIDHAYYSEAKQDGVTRWRGLSPHRPMFGYSVASELLVVIAPLREG
jgi:hypothetical protein